MFGPVKQFQPSLIFHGFAARALRSKKSFIRLAADKTFFGLLLLRQANKKAHNASLRLKQWRIFGAATFDIMTLSIITLSIMTLGIMTVHNDAEHNDTEHNDTEHNDPQVKDTKLNITLVSVI